MQLIQGLFKNRKTTAAIKTVFLSSIIATCLGALGGVITARILNPSELGQFRAFTIPILYLTILHLGTPDGLYKLIPSHSGRGDLVNLNSTIETAKVWSLTLATMTSLAFIYLSTKALIDNRYEDFAGWASQAVACWGVFYGTYLSTIYRSLQQFGQVSRIELIQSISQFILVSVLPALRFYGMCIRSALPSAISILLLTKFKTFDTKLRFNPRIFIDIIHTGFPFFFWIYISSPVWLATESALILHLSGNEALGYLAIAVIIREAISVLPQSIHQVLLPKTVEDYAKTGEIKEINKELIRIAIITSIAMMIISIFATYLAHIAIPIILPKYVNALNIIGVATIFPVIQALSLPLNSLFATGKSSLYGRSIIFGVAFFMLSTALYLQYMDAALSVMTGSLTGRTVRLIVAYAYVIRNDRD